MTEFSLPEQTRGGLKPGELARSAYGVLWRGRGELLRVAAVPAALILLIDAAPDLWLSLDSSASLQAADILSSLLVLLSAPLAMVMAVNWLRVLVLGGSAVPGLGVRWGRRESRFLLRWIVIAVIGFAATAVFALPILFAMLAIDQAFAVPELVMQLVPLPVFVLVMLVYGYLILRYSPALVTAAIEAPGGLGDGWKATRRLGGLLLLAAIPVVGPFYLLVFLAPALLNVSGIEAAAPLSSQLLQTTLGMLTYAAGLALVSVIYRRLGGLPGASA